MPLDDFIITVYCLVDDLLKELTKNHHLRARGPAPKLTDTEVIAMEIIGEYLGFNDTASIWSYFKQHWLNWFPNLGDRTAFARQSTNLMQIKDLMQQKLSAAFEDDTHLFDGLPIPIRHIKRFKQSTNMNESGAVGYCASKDAYYFGFTGNLLITAFGCIKGFALTPANTSERDALPGIIKNIKGLLIADKGLIGPQLSNDLRANGINLQTPLRSNMKDNRPKSFVQTIMSMRRLIETVIGQLVERFGIQKIRAKDQWHLAAKVGRKLLAHTVIFVLNLSLNPLNPLQFEGLLM